MLSIAGERQNIRPLAIVGICGLSSILIYLFVFVLPFWLPTYALIPFPPLSGFNSPGAPLLLTAFIVLFALYYISYRLTPTTTSRAFTTLIFVVPIIAAAMLLFMTTFTSSDVSDYIMRAHLYAHLGVNAMVVPPAAFPNDPFLPFIYWSGNATGYGPIWEMMAIAVAWLIGVNYLSLIIGFKLLITTHFLATLPALYLALRAWDPALALRGLLLFGWNPLLLFELTGNGHNDAVMLCWLMIAIALLLRNHIVWAMLALNVAILVKFIPIVLIPVLLVYWWKNRGETPALRQLGVMAGTLLAMGAMAYLLYLPFGLGNALHGYSQLLNLVQESLPWLVAFTIASHGAQWESTLALVRLAADLILLTFIGWYAARIFRSNGVQDRRYWLLLGCFEIVYAYLFFTSLRIYPWYVS